MPTANEPAMRTNEPTVRKTRESTMVPTLEEIMNPKTSEPSSSGPPIPNNQSNKI